MFCLKQKNYFILTILLSVLYNCFMKYTRKMATLGISRKDFRILYELRELKQSKVLPFANRLSTKRTTLAFRLHKLAERNLVERVKVRGHFEWRLTYEGRKLLGEESGNVEFKIKYYNGTKNVKNIIDRILREGSNERIYFIEPYQQTKALFSTYTPKTQAYFARLFQEKKNISEGVSSSKNLELLSQYSKKVLQNMLGRMAIIYVVPDQYLRFKNMLMTQKNSTYIFDFTKEQAVEVQSELFSKSIVSLVLSLQALGKKIDLNEYIRNILNQ